MMNMSWAQWWAYSRMIACVSGSIIIGKLFGFYVGLAVGLLVFSLIPTEVDYYEEEDNGRVD